MLVSVAEAVTFLVLSRTTIGRLVREERIPVVRIGGRVLFRRQALEDFVKRNERPIRPKAGRRRR